MLCQYITVRVYEYSNILLSIPTCACACAQVLWSHRSVGGRARARDAGSDHRQPRRSLPYAREAHQLIALSCPLHLSTFAFELKPNAQEWRASAFGWSSRRSSWATSRRRSCARCTAAASSRSSVRLTPIRECPTCTHTTFLIVCNFLGRLARRSARGACARRGGARVAARARVHVRRERRRRRTARAAAEHCARRAARRRRAARVPTRAPPTQQRGATRHEARHRHAAARPRETSRRLRRFVRVHVLILLLLLRQQPHIRCIYPYLCYCASSSVQVNRQCI